DHVLLPWASRIAEVDPGLRARLSAALFAEVAEQIPDSWLSAEPDLPTPADLRAGYVTYLTRRLEAAPAFVEEALRARANLV
ncbi:MAG TPA: aminotransferase class I and II, partial [Thermoanaerobaculia bacterium]|nr:aminotransferase class I and II [Thermoanaerobaculia bacterium]